MNLGINNTVFKGHIKFEDSCSKKQNIDTKDIEEFGIANNKAIYIKTKKDRGFDAPNGKGRYLEEITFIPAENIQKDYDRFMKVYDIASRNNVTIKYLGNKDKLDEYLDI